jgi:hypothetical protein
VNLAGPQADSQVTGAEGCVFFANFPVGGYTLSYSRAGYVDPSGVQTISVPATIPEQQTTSQSRQYDQAGTLNATFWTYGNGAYTATTGTVLSAYHSGVPVRSGYTTATSATAVAALSIGSLFPFTSAYTVFSGSCATNAIPAGTLRTQLDTDGYRQSVSVPAGSAVAAKVFEPAIHPTVRYQTGTSGGVPVFSARAANVVVKSTVASCPSSVSLTTQATGTLPVASRGFPYGTYTVCGEVQSGGVWRRGTIQTVTPAARETAVAIDIPSSATANLRCPT